MNELKVASFIAGYTGLYDVVSVNPDLRMVPIAHLDAVRNGLYHLGYDFRIRYRGPHARQRDTLKCNARAFTVYIRKELV
jgi:hypothetical protein